MGTHSVILDKSKISRILRKFTITHVQMMEFRYNFSDFASPLCSNCAKQESNLRLISKKWRQDVNLKVR